MGLLQAYILLLWRFPKASLGSPKTGRKLHLGKKSTPMVIIMSLAKGQQKEQIQELGFKDSYTRCFMGFLAPIINSSLEGCYKNLSNKEFKKIK